MQPNEDILLKDELAKHKGKTVLVGSKSSFFYVGPCEEALSDLHSLGLMNRFCIALSAKKDISKQIAKYDEDIGLRKVCNTYVRDSEYGADEVVILVEGKELGAYWTREEYLIGRKALNTALELATSRNAASE